MQQNESLVDQNDDDLKYAELPIQNHKRAILYAVIMSISTMYYGYSLTLIPASSLHLLFSYYHISLSQTTTISLLNGILPLGGILGSLSLPYIIPCTTKRRINYGLTVASLIVCGISVIPSFYAIMVSRFLLGSLVSMYCSVSADYIKQSYPTSRRKYYGAIYSCGRVFGILVCYMIGYLSNYSQGQSEHIIVFFGPAYLSVIQAILIWKFLSQSPVEMVKKKNSEEALKALKLLYSPKNAQKRLMQIQDETRQNIKKTEVFQAMKFTNPKNMTSIHLAVLRHFCGMSYIVVYAGQIIASFDVADSKIAPVVINSVQLAANIMGVFLVQKISRTNLLVVSCWLMGVINLIIGFADINQFPVLCIAMMSLFMIPCGAGLSTVVYSYPSELVVAQQGKYTGAVSWLANAIVNIVPPYIVEVMPDKLAYPMFFFFAFYLGIVTVVNFKLLPLAQNIKEKTEYVTRKDQV